MIRPLRQRHRHLVAALAIFLPVAFAIGIAARRPVPEAGSSPLAAVSATGRFESQEWQRTDLFTNAPVQVRLLREHQGVGQFAVELSAGEDFAEPDLIVYWTVENPAITGTLPGDAILLGTFSPGRLPLPAAAVQAGGRLVLFSLADNAIVDTSKPIRFDDSTR